MNEKTGKTEKRESYPVSFRMDAYYLRLLERGATAHGISIQRYARQRLCELLDRQEEARLLEELQGIRAALEGIRAELREDTATSTEAILANITKDPASVRQWVDKNLRGRK